MPREIEGIFNIVKGNVRNKQIHLNFVEFKFKSPGLNVCDSTLNLKDSGRGEAEINEFLWTALLEIKEGIAGPLQRCGGTLISDMFCCY